MEKTETTASRESGDRKEKREIPAHQGKVFLSATLKRQTVRV